MGRSAAAVLALLILPGLAYGQQPVGTHPVVDDDTLWDLAVRYYQNPFEWRVIYEANRDSIVDPNLIFLTGGPPLVLMIVLAALAATTIILWPIMRAFGRRLEGKSGADPLLRAEVEQLHARIGEMDALQARIAELEERVDFTERLLAQNREPDRLQR